MVELAEIITGETPFADLIALGEDRVLLTLFFQRHLVEFKQMADSLQRVEFVVQSLVINESDRYITSR